MFRESGTALSQDMIESRIKSRMDRVTIYRVLNSFCEDGILHRITSEEGKNYYALCDSCEEHHHHHNHFHFRCLGCSVVECLDEEVHVPLPKGYSLENINCWVSGYCKNCRTVPASA